MLSRLYLGYGFGAPPSLTNLGTIYGSFTSVELIKAYNLDVARNERTPAAVATAECLPHLFAGIP
jgi:hypothetical protein